MTALTLFAAPKPPEVEGIHLECCNVADLLPRVRDASLVVADPPWMYKAGVPGHGTMREHYDGLLISQISEHIDAAWDCAAEDAYLLLWVTWPILMDPKGWDIHRHAGRWIGKTGGAWAKTGLLGTGYHWRGNSEGVLVYVKGKPKPSATIRNLGVSKRMGGGMSGPDGRHSEKPLAWCSKHVEAFCRPGGSCLDLYAGMSPYARACADLGRSYRGAEISPKRHADALGLLAHHVGRHQ